MLHINDEPLQSELAQAPGPDRKAAVVAALRNGVPSDKE